MTRERIQRQIDLALDECEAAFRLSDWQTVARASKRVLLLDRENIDAQVFAKAAATALQTGADEDASPDSVPRGSQATLADLVPTQPALPTERLFELADQLDTGRITQSEFTERRAEILAGRTDAFETIAEGDGSLHESSLEPSRRETGRLTRSAGPEPPAPQQQGIAAPPRYRSARARAIWMLAAVMVVAVALFSILAGWQEFLLLVVVALWAGVVWRAVTLARERGRNPWFWGIAAFILASPGLAIIPGILLLIWLARGNRAPVSN